MDSDRAEGKLKQTEGTLQEGLGDVKETLGGNGAADKAEGKTKQREGELQAKWGEAKDKAEELWEKAKDAVRSDDTPDKDNTPER